MQRYTARAVYVYSRLCFDRLPFSTDSLDCGSVLQSSSTLVHCVKHLLQCHAAHRPAHVRTRMGAETAPLLLPIEVEQCRPLVLPPVGRSRPSAREGKLVTTDRSGERGMEEFFALGRVQ